VGVGCPKLVNVSTALLKVGAECPVLMSRIRAAAAISGFFLGLGGSGPKALNRFDRWVLKPGVESLISMDSDVAKSCCRK
jgi:hypothetical protein